MGTQKNRDTSLFLRSGSLLEIEGDAVSSDISHSSALRKKGCVPVWGCVPVLLVTLVGCGHVSLPWRDSAEIMRKISVRPIISLEGDQYITSWSPDSSQLALMSYMGKNWDVWTMNVDGTNLRQLTDEPSWDDAAAWSPDGRWLVFSSDRVNVVWPDLWLLDLEGQTPLKRLTRGDGKYFFPRWSPDGAQIAFLYLPTGPPRL